MQSLEPAYYHITFVTTTATIARAGGPMYAVARAGLLPHYYYYYYSSSRPGTYILVLHIVPMGMAV